MYDNLFPRRDWKLLTCSLVSSYIPSLPQGECDHGTWMSGYEEAHNSVALTSRSLWRTSSRSLRPVHLASYSFRSTLTDVTGHPDDIWALSWTAADRLVSGCADGHLRVYDPLEFSAPLYDIAANPLAVTSLSASRDGKLVLASSLDGSVTLTDVLGGRVIGRVETSRSPAVAGEKGKSFWEDCPAALGEGVSADHLWQSYQRTHVLCTQKVRCGHGPAEHPRSA